MGTRFKWQLALEGASLKSGRSTCSQLGSPHVCRTLCPSALRTAHPSPRGSYRKASGPLGHSAPPNWTTILLIALLLFIYAHSWWHCLVNGALLQANSSAHTQEHKTHQGSHRSPHTHQIPSTSDQSNGRERQSPSSGPTASSPLPFGDQPNGTGARPSLGPTLSAEDQQQQQTPDAPRGSFAYADQGEGPSGEQAQAEAEAGARAPRQTTEGQADAAALASSVILADASMQMGPRERRLLEETLKRGGGPLGRKWLLLERPATQDVRVFWPELLKEADGIPHEARRTRRTAPAGPQQPLTSSKKTQTPNEQPHGARTSVVIKAFNYNLRLDLELNDVLFGPNLVQKHFIPKGTHISAHQLDNCYYHARSSPLTGSGGDSRPQPVAIGAFRTCNGLSGIIHVNNESLVIHPFYNADLSKKQPHIIYRYQTAVGAVASLGQEPDGQVNPMSATTGECANSRAPNEWTLRQYSKPSLDVEALGVVGADLAQTPISTNSSDERFKRDTSQPASAEQQRNATTKGRRAKPPAHLVAKRDVGLVPKYIELALVLSKDMFSKRNTLSRLEVLHDAIQIINCLDLYFRRSATTRVGIVYIETWAHGDQIEISDDPKQTLYNFLGYSERHLYATSRDAAHLITGGHLQQFHSNSFGMSIPDSMCTGKAVSVSQESNMLEPFMTAATIAHLLGHNLGMEHDRPQSHRGAALEKPLEAQTTTGASSAPLAAAQESTLQTPLVGPALAAAVAAKTPTFAGLPQGQASAKNMGGSPLSTSSASSDELSDEHDEEVKSRSLNLEQQLRADTKEEAQLADEYSRGWLEQDLLESSDCNRASCIMNDRFVFPHPPAALGNMVEQVPVQHSHPDDSSSSSFSSSSSSAAAAAASAQGSGAFISSSVSIKQQEHLETFTVRETSSSSTGQEQFSSQNHLEHNQDAQGWLGTGSLPFRFSRRSVETYFGLLREGRNYCLWNKPNKLESSIVATCGNGIVERDEDCDCGTRANCWNDTCCERLTCKFRKGSECLSGACCDRCRFRPRGSLCRRARGECDLPEFCDGNSFVCGPDLYKQNGHSCSSGAGYCFMGQCPTHDAQCGQLWGANARNSERLCYTQLNSNGTIWGNCGRSPGTDQYTPSGLASGRQKSQNANLKRCEPEHLMCGTLQCQLGDMKPITAEPPEAGGHHESKSSSSTSSSTSAASSYEFSRKILRHNGRDMECKVITKPLGLGRYGPGRASHAQQSQGPQAPFTSSISYVRDGTKCADKRVCFNQTCLSLERAYQEAYELCPRDEQGHFCSQHGVCSTANRCHCDSGWIGDDCSQAVPQQQQQQQQQSQAEHQPNGQLMELISPVNGHAQTQAATSRLPPLQQILVVAPPTLANSSQQPVATIVQMMTTTQQPTTTAMQPPQPQPQSQQQQPPPSTTNYLQDKTKHNALEAQTLVYILVSIVTAVYVGFAIMANCYRRKGFLKPDKVLRHHQMNCRMDALRSSFIAKRLADASEGLSYESAATLANNGGNEFIAPAVNDNNPNIMNQGGGGGGGSGNGSNQSWAPLLEANGNSRQAIDLLEATPFVSPLSGNSNQMRCQFAPQASASHGQHHEPTVHMNVPSSIRSHFHGQPMKPPALPPHFKQRQAIQATVHYVDQNEHNHAGSGDHIPLLAGGTSTAADQAPPHQQRQPPMSSFAANQIHHHRTLADRRLGPNPRRHLYQVQAGDRINLAQQQPPPNQPTATWTKAKLQASQGDYDAEGEQLVGKSSRSSSINRAISLGNVHRHQQNLASQQQHEDDEVNPIRNGAPRGGYMAHGALATPSRSSRSQLASARERASSIGLELRRQHSREHPLLTPPPPPITSSGLAVEFDSCSAPSSPEHRADYWSSARASKEMRHKQSTTARQGRSFEQRQDVATLDLSPDLSVCSPSPPPPPPPLPPLPPFVADSNRQLEASGDENDAGDDDDDDNNNNNNNNKNDNNNDNNNNQADGEPRSQRSSRPTRRGQAQLSASHHQRAQQLVGLHDQHWSLIAQLQQLERVQSLHQKQVSGGGSAGDLHEFFSLPLSVQLSALLTRSLAEPQLNQHEPMNEMEEYLDTLNSTSVAAMSRRSFKSLPKITTATAAAATTTTRQQAGGDCQIADGAPNHHQAQSGSSAANSRGGTMRKQQAKLQNLQNLIIRLQKLHNQSLVQQQQQHQFDGDDELDLDLDIELEDEQEEEEQLSFAARLAQRIPNVCQSRQSTLGRATQRRAGAGLSRAPGRAADDSQVYAPGSVNSSQAGKRRQQQQQQQQQQMVMMMRRQMRRSDSHKSQRADKTDDVAAAAAAAAAAMVSRSSSRNDFVYSMSDSEDGETYASRRQLMAAARARQHQQYPATTSNSGQRLVSVASANVTGGSSGWVESKGAVPTNKVDRPAGQHNDQSSSQAADHSQTSAATQSSSVEISAGQQQETAQDLGNNDNQIPDKPTC